MPSDKGPLGNFLQKKYIQWITEVGDVKSQLEFAAHLGLDPVALNRYLNGTRRHLDREVADKLADTVGDEIYTVVGYISPRFQEINETLIGLDEENLKLVLEYIQKLKGARS